MHPLVINQHHDNEFQQLQLKNVLNLINIKYIELTIAI